MKKVFFILFLIITNYGFSQSPIINVVNNDGYKIVGAYYKDIDNEFDKFEGTYLYEDANVYFKIMLQKKTMQFDGKYYSDLIVGEYQYKVDNVEKINTLNEINTTYSSPRRHKIACYYFVPYHGLQPECLDCAVNELRTFGTFKEPISGNSAQITIRKIIVSGSEAINIYLSGNPVIYNIIDPVPPNSLVKFGEYVLIKQP